MRTLTLLFMACVAAACVRTRTDPATGSMDVDVESPAQKGEDWSGRLAGQGTHTGITGSHSATVLNGQTNVKISLSGATAGATHPWHVHEGQCSTGGPIVGDPAAYTPLTVGQDGSAQGNAKLAVALDEAKDYHVNVHLSQNELATIIACGDLDD